VEVEVVNIMVPVDLQGVLEVAVEVKLRQVVKLLVMEMIHPLVQHKEQTAEVELIH
jgi:hypothetical protein